MKIRSRLTIYLVFVHFVFMTLAAFLLWDSHRPWIALVEAFLVGTLIIGISLIRQLHRMDVQA